MRWSELWIGLCLLIALVAGPRAGAETPVTLTVGVRADAPPFSYKAGVNDRFNRDTNVVGPLFQAGYRGYVVLICDHALRRVANRLPDVRFDVMELTTRTRFGAEQANWQILCDPATLTDGRLESGHDPTVPIYLSGIGYASTGRIPKGNECVTVAGVADNTTTEHGGIQAVAESGEVPRFRQMLLDAIKVNGAQGLDDAICRGRVVPAVVRQDTHGELAAALCAGEILYYIGDYEIVRSNLEAMQGCEFTMSEQTYRDERYTIFTRNEDLDEAQMRALDRFRAEVARGVLEQNSVLLRAYQTYLSSTAPSRKLAAFYWGLIGRFE